MATRKGAILEAQSIVCQMQYAWEGNGSDDRGSRHAVEDRPDGRGQGQTVLGPGQLAGPMPLMSQRGQTDGGHPWIFAGVRR